MGGGTDTGHSSPLDIKDGDCDLFADLLGKFNLSGIEKIQKANCGIVDIADALHEKVKARSIFSQVANQIAKKENSIRKEREWAIINFVVLLLVILLASTVLGLFVSQVLSVGESTPVSYWSGFWYTFTYLFWIPILVALWRGYIDLYPRAAFRYWWTEKDKVRDPIRVEDISNYLIEELQKEDFGRLIDLSTFTEHRNELVDYRDSLESAKKTLGSGSRARGDGKYSNAFKRLTEQIDRIDKKLKEIRKHIISARESAKKLSGSILPAYKEEAVEICEFLSSMQRIKRNEKDDELIKETKEKLSTSRQEVINEVDSLNQSLQTARYLLDEELKEFKLLNGEKLHPTGGMIKERKHN